MCGMNCRADRALSFEFQIVQFGEELVKLLRFFCQFSLFLLIEGFQLTTALPCITVRTVTLGGFHFKRIFEDQKLKNHIFTSFSPYRCNPFMVKSSFCQYA